MSTFNDHENSWDSAAHANMAATDYNTSHQGPTPIHPTPAIDVPSLSRPKSSHHDQSRCMAPHCSRILKRPYNKRCRLCSDHMASAELQLEGGLRRFCQKCGKLHPLEEFEGLKRSCRFGLYRHNLRQKALRSLKVNSSSPTSSEGSLGNGIDGSWSSGKAIVSPVATPPTDPIQQLPSISFDDFLLFSDQPDDFLVDWLLSDQNLPRLPPQKSRGMELPPIIQLPGDLFC